VTLKGRGECFLPVLFVCGSSQAPGVWRAVPPIGGFFIEAGARPVLDEALGDGSRPWSSQRCGRACVPESAMRRRARRPGRRAWTCRSRACVHDSPEARTLVRRANPRRPHTPAGGLADRSATGKGKASRATLALALSGSRKTQGEYRLDHGFHSLFGGCSMRTLRPWQRPREVRKLEAAVLDVSRPCAGQRELQRRDGRRTKIDNANHYSAPNCRGYQLDVRAADDRFGLSPALEAVRSSDTPELIFTRPVATGPREFALPWLPWIWAVPRRLGDSAS